MCFFFFFNDTATTEIYTLSLHDALPISPVRCRVGSSEMGHPSCELIPRVRCQDRPRPAAADLQRRSEEHTSELQSRPHLVCRLLLEKKKKDTKCTWLTPRYRV